METYEKDSKFYGIAFLINAEQNMASFPQPWKIDPANLIRIAKTAIGKPWLPGGPIGTNDKHFRVPSGEYDGTAQHRSIKEHFKRAAGIITDIVENKETGNISVIIELNPKYAEKIDHKEVSQFVSPMVEGITQDPDTYDIIDATVVHLHSVDKPGYKPSVARFFGTCEGTHEKCKRQLTPLAASGGANNTLKALLQNSSMEPPMTPPQTGMPPAAGTPPPAAAPGMEGGGDMEQVKATVVSMGEELDRVEDIIDQNSAVTQQLAAAAGVDPNQFQMCKQAQPGMDGEEQTGMPPQEPQAAMGHKMAAAAGTTPTPADQKMLKLTQQLELMKRQIAERDARDAIAERKRMAEIIAKGQITLGLNKVTKKDYQAIVDKYVNMKHPSNPNQLMDLTLNSMQFQEVLNGLVQSPAEEQAAVAQTTAAAPQTPEEPLTIAAATGYPYTPAVAKPAVKPDYDAMERAILE